MHPALKNALKSLKGNIIYVKFLDIGLRENSEIGPLALLECPDTASLTDKIIIPCVFITNAVFQNLSGNKADWLADKTLTALHSVAEQLPFGKNFNPQELQIDCDWTESTRKQYFLYLNSLKKRLPTNTRLCATIRLHQYKFPDKTGVPPADRGMLMLYNTGDIEDMQAKNSIFSVKDALRYIQGAPRQYALPLDVALPVFSWALVYRNETLWKILHAADTSLFSDTLRFQRHPLKPNVFGVRQSTFVRGHYLRPGDYIRLEGIDPALLREALACTRQIDLAPDAVYALFQADSTLSRTFPPDTLQRIWQQFLDKKQ